MTNETNATWTMGNGQTRRVYGEAGDIWFPGSDRHGMGDARYEPIEWDNERGDNETAWQVIGYGGVVDGRITFDEVADVDTAEFLREVVRLGASPDGAEDWLDAAREMGLSVTDTAASLAALCVEDERANTERP